MNTNLKPFFTSKKIVYSVRLQPAELIQTFTSSGKKFCRVAFTNQVQYIGTIPITDIPFDQVTGIRKMPSRFKTWAYSLIGKKAKPTFFHFNNPLKKA